MTKCYICNLSKTTFYRFSKNEYDIFFCKACKLHFVYPQPSSSELKKIYDIEYFNRGNKYSKHSEANLKNNKKKINLIQKYKKNGNLLDIGAAKGEFLVEARNMGYNVFGIEISHEAYAIAKNKINKIKNTDLISARYNSNFFDIITLWDVIEHVKNPHEVINEISRILSPGGFVFLSTGDINSNFSKIFGRYWHLLTPPQHLFFFSPESIELLFSKKDVLNHKGNIFTGKYVSLGFLSFKAVEMFGKIFSPIKHLISLCKLDSYLIKINLNDIFIGVWQKNSSKSN